MCLPLLRCPENVLALTIFPLTQTVLFVAIFYSLGVRSKDITPLVLRVLMKHLNIAPENFRYDENALYLNDVVIPALNQGTGGLPGGRQQWAIKTLINYHSRRAPAEQLSISQCLAVGFNPNQIAGQDRDGGHHRPQLKRSLFTPLSARIKTRNSPCRGSSSTPRCLSQMLDVMAYQNALYRSLPPWLEAGWLLIWCLIAGGIPG